MCKNISMIYLIYGTQPVKMKNRIKKVIKEFFGNEEVDQNSIYDLDLDTDTIFNVLDEINQFSLTSPKKIINVKNAKIFESQLKNKFSKKEIDEIINCLSNIDVDTCVIFSLNASKVSTTNEIYKIINKDGKIFQFKEITKEEWPSVAKDYFSKRGITLDDETIEELVNRTNLDVSFFINEAEKLILYKGNQISLQDIKDLVPNSLETDSFKVLNALLEGNKSQALKVYNDLRIKNIEVITLIYMITSSLIYALNVKNLQKMGKSNDEIAKETGSSPGRVFITNRNFKKYSIDFLLNTISKLNELDRKIKHSEIDRFYGFELFILNF